MEQQSDEAFMDDTLEELFAELDAEDDPIGGALQRLSELDSGNPLAPVSGVPDQPAVHQSPNGESTAFDEPRSEASLDLIAAADQHLARLLGAASRDDESRSRRDSLRSLEDTEQSVFQFPQLAGPEQAAHEDILSGTGGRAESFDECRVEIELGRAVLDMREVALLTQGCIVSLDKLAGDPVDLVVDGRLFARGEVLVTDNQFCVRIAEIVSRSP